ncbi:restriction endonuclease subunit S [Salmonella enterica subsp. enterica serovar Typhimurium]|uniref:Restriction endonuclease subunit S n=1 Tax=Salmonella enterica subsp. enterica serovar Braenderup TaxID=149391 RepID=A0A5J1F7P5_SALET|nr:restriction endonuclease subunit S [Citrobacter braakii]EAA0960124.1 restriction endonuclease subunit S [Salmonella enterica subsp. enterica serovar Typhimurium]EAA4173546.1 restriction endonuclease subunit S [Salmonella enterica subsp. enterica serovar Braenderup]EAB9051004.1 restriction endonuclease subunit S [Salmonella enterica subsp. enterica serovar Oranienburg]EAR3350430.1 restriction endonuclease subunit S [Salmonella enterica]EBQ9291751.1 restriction endonuclease subunit S [Salmone
MSEMSYLEKLLDGVEVEWKTLGEVAKYVRGLIYSKSSESADGQGYKVLRANNITLSNNCLNLNDVKVVRFDTKVKSSQKLYKNDILISAASGSREHVGKVAYIESDIDYYFGGFMGVVRCDEKLNPRYLFHVLTSDIFQKYLDEMLNSSTINNLNSAVMGRFKIPLPCPDNPEKSLAIQSEIVRILDKFTALTAELTAELTMRKKQYNYYRDQLLSFDEGEVEWRTLGEIGEVRMCKRILKSQTSSEGEIPFYKIGTFGKEPDSYISRKLFNEFKEKYSYPKVGEVLISASGTIGRTVIFDGRESYFQDSNIVWIENNEKIVLNKYLFYFYKIAKWGISEGGTIKRLYNDNLRKLMIPVPFPDSPERSLVEQQKIVKLLDKFDALTNSITEGLPREIELRQKQYEYYRDLLFSFPKPDSVTN